MCYAGSAFKMADVPVREQLGRGAAQKATLSLRRKSAARQGTPLGGLKAGLTPGRGKTPGTPLSAAGKKLLSNLRGGTPSGNAQLRASYKPQTPGLCCFLGNNAHIVGLETMARLGHDYGVKVHDGQPTHLSTSNKFAVSNLCCMFGPLFRP